MIRLNMFQRLRLQFIAIATGAVCVILLSVFGVMNVVIQRQSDNQINTILKVIADNGGVLSKPAELEQKLGEKVTLDTLNRYSYFSAILTKDGKVQSYDASHVQALSDQQITKYSSEIYQIDQTKGQLILAGSPYAYRLEKRKNGTYLLVGLDVSAFARISYNLLKTSMGLGLSSLTFFLLVIITLSGKVIAPFVRNYEKQRRFITNAGHELKTPLAIISANNELVELMNGESEWTKSTSDQVERLTGLINSLVTQARLEEQSEVLLQNLDFSAITQDAAEDFKGPVIKDGKHFVMDIQKGIYVKAEEKSLFELVTLLVDNANKYCDDGGTVTVSLSKPKRSRRARLVISNTYVQGRGVNYHRFFERFYREDESHHSGKSGYGIGLSIVEGLVKRFKGRIKVTYKDDTIYFMVFL